MRRTAVVKETGDRMADKIEVKQLVLEMESLADRQQAKILSRFFKTGPGQYGEGDLFLGIKVPLQRRLAVRYKDLPHREVLELLRSPYHEHRLAALLIWGYRYKNSPGVGIRAKIYSAYLRNTLYINNWDLVDLSAPGIVGCHLLDRDRSVLYELAGSPSLWERRIAILATYAFISRGESEDTFAIADRLLNDRHDLIHKAVGWMLREVGKRVSEAKEKAFLESRYRRMPRTMLRYAIERFSEGDRKHFMAKDDL